MKIRNSFVSNSSSACFICNTFLNKERVKEKLSELIEFYNIFVHKNLSYQEIFHEPKLYKELNDYDKETLSQYIKNYDMVFDIEDEQIVLYSADDNSVPYCFFDLIQEGFDAKHIHLG